MSIKGARRARGSYAKRVVVCVLFVTVAFVVVTFPRRVMNADNKREETKQATEKRLNAQDENGAALLWQEAEVLRSEQRSASNQKAIEKYQLASEAWNSVGTAELAARASRSAGEVYQILGELGNAIKSFKEALDLSKKAKSKIEEGGALNGLAYAYFLKGDSKAAYTNSLAALKISRQLGDQQVEAAALSNLGESLYAFGDLSAALKHQQQASDLWQELHDLKGQATAQVALGYYSAKLGEPHSALVHLEQGLKAAEQAGDLRGQVLAFNAAGNIKAKLGRNQEALDAYAAAGQLAERIGDRLFLASILAGKASLYFWLGEAQRALEYDEQSIAIFKVIDAKWGTAEITLDLGRVHNSLGNHQLALHYLKEALDRFRQLGMIRLEAQTFREIGLMELSTGDSTDAIRSFEQAVNLTRNGQDHSPEANVLNLIGKVYENLKQPDRALEYYKRALPLSRLAADPVGEANTLCNLAHIDRDQGKLADAEQKLKEAIAIDESIRMNVSSQDLRASYFATVRATYELYIDVLMLRHKVSPQEGFAARAFAVSEKARARSFLESLRDGQADIREGVDSSLVERERLLNETLNAKADRQMKLLAAKETAEADTVKKEIDVLTAEYATVRDQIRATSPKYAALTSVEPLDLAAVQQQLLDDDSILLEYALGDDRSYVWVVTRSQLSTFELPARKDIEESGRRLYSDITAYQALPGESVEQLTERRRKATESIPAETGRLSKLVLGPLAGKLDEKRLLVILDGALQYIPFQALNNPNSNMDRPEPLFAKHEIVNEPSASALAVLIKDARKRKSASNSVAVLADPVFEVDDPRVSRASQTSTPESVQSLTVKEALRDIGISADGVQIPRLVASSREADAIMKSAPWGTGLKAVGFAATRQRVLGHEFSDYRVVHFATHGLMNNDHPELSGIVLSLFDQQGRSQDGFLRLHDIYNLRLPADLVVLSACSTGLGKDVRGEGLVGLTRGFMYSGASGVVASLWKVDDEATAELMQRFYEGLFQKGMPPAAALKFAQISMSQQKAWQSPYYWAGFVIQGRYDQQVSGSAWSYRTSKRLIALSVVLSAVFASFLLMVVRQRRRKII
jgi:CHAT domain-containing protein